MKKILIVDDDSGILDALTVAIETSGYEVLGILDARQIEKQIASFIPDLILMDLLLAGSDGTELTRKLKSNSATASIPIVILSAHPSARVQAQKAGADDFLAKPFNLDELLAKLRKFIP